MSTSQNNSTQTSGLNSIKNETKLLAESTKVQISHYIIAAASLVVALNWNDAIKAAINRIYPVPDDPEKNINAVIFYAILLTIGLVILIRILPDTKDALPEETRNKLNNIENMNSRRRGSAVLRFAT